MPLTPLTAQHPFLVHTCQHCWWMFLGCRMTSCWGSAWLPGVVLAALMAAWINLPLTCWLYVVVQRKLKRLLINLFVFDVTIGRRL